MNQLTAGAGPFTLTSSWYDADGVLDPDVNAVTIGVVDGNGDTTVAAGTATTDNDDGTYDYALADIDDPDQLTATWTATTGGAKVVQRVEIVGSQLFTIAQARAFGSKDDASSTVVRLKSTTEYLTATIQDERTRIVDDLETWTGRAWIPRYARLELPGTGTNCLDLRRGLCRTSDGYLLHRPGRLLDIAEVLSATIDGTAVTLTDIEIDTVLGRLYHTDGVWTAGSSTTPYNVVVEYVYGAPYLIDGVDRIALKLLVDRLVPSAVPDRALRWDLPDGSSMGIVQPGGPMGNRSRIPEVNDWVNNHNYWVYV